MKRRRKQNRISELPEHIIHRILSFLPTRDAARTSVLSKTWRHIWSSFPVFDFDEAFIRTKKRRCWFQDDGAKNKKFSKFVHNTLVRRGRNFDNISIDRFRLCMGIVAGLDFARIDSWIRFALKRNVKELDVRGPRINHPIWTDRNPPYALPLCVFFTAKSITVLKLESCRLEGVCYVELPSLRSLSLFHVDLEDQMFLSILSGCPSIEDLRILWCTGLKHVKASCPKIKFMDLKFSHSLETVVIEASSLLSFNLVAVYTMHELNIAACRAITNLSLERADFLTDVMLGDLIYQLPLLENLVLDGCSALQSIVISSQKLKSFVLNQCFRLVEAKVDTPNLVKLVYAGNMVSFSSLNTSNRLEAKVFLNFKYVESRWYINLRHLLERFNHCEVLTLASTVDLFFIAPKEMSDYLLPPLYNLKDLKLELSTLCRRDSMLVDSLIRVFPSLRTLSINLQFPIKCLKFRFENGVPYREDTQDK